MCYSKSLNIKQHTQTQKPFGHLLPFVKTHSADEEHFTTHASPLLPPRFAFCAVIAFSCPLERIHVSTHFQTFYGNTKNFVPVSGLVQSVLKVEQLAVWWH